MYMRDYMKLENKFKIFIVFLILLLSIGSVSANEDADSDSLGLSENEDIGLSDNIGIGDIDLDDSLSSVDDKVDLELSAEENAIGLESSGSDKLGDPSKTLDEIQSLVDSANDGDTILLSGNYASSGKAVNISKSLTIDGQGTTTLDGKGASACIFYTDLDSGKVIIKGITFTNAHDSALRAYSTDSISIENCAFNNNGASITIYSSNSTVIKNCVFNNNNNNYLDVWGPAIYVESLDSRISNCTFVNNSVELYIDSSYNAGPGGAVYSNCNYSEISNCSFISNRAAQEGGAIYDISNQSKISACTFKGNNAYKGGAIYADSKNSEIINCIFTSNGANRGGAIYWSSENAGKISDCTFKSNNAPYDGGAIYWTSKSKSIFNCKFTDNKSPRENDIGGFYTLKVSKSGVYAGNILLNIGVYNAFTGKGAKNPDVQLIFTNSKGKQIIKSLAANAKGILKYYVALPAGKYSANINVADLNKKLTITVKKFKAKLSASRLTTTYKSGKTFNVKMVNTKNKKKPTNVKIALKVYTGKKAKTYYAYTKNGVARFDISSVSVGTHKVVASSALSSAKASKIKSRIIIKKHKFKITAAKVTNKYKKDQYFKVKVISKNTKKPAKNLKIRVKAFKGRLYNAYTIKTNAKGIALLNTKDLRKGTHKVTITSGDKNCKFTKKSTIVIK